MSQNPFNWRDIHKAVKQRNVPQIRRLLFSGADVNIINNQGLTPLGAAVEENRKNSHFETIKVLLESGANANATNKYGNTCLHYLIRQSYSDTKLIELLLEFKADVSIKNRNGETTLVKAIIKGDLKIVKLLSNHHSNLDIINEIYENYCWQKFINIKNFEIIFNYILKIGANINFTTLKNMFFNINQINLITWLKFVRLDCITSSLSNSNLKYYMSEETWKIYFERIAKLQSLDIVLDPLVTENISAAKNRIGNYFQKCADELVMAKNIKLNHCWVSYFNLLVDDKRKLKNYAGNDDLIKDFENSNCLKKFPIYGQEMQENVNKGIKIRKAFDVSAEILSYCLPIFNPTHLIVRDTLDCLTYKYYKKLATDDLSE